MRTLFLAAAFLALGACPTKISSGTGACSNDRDCATGQTCQNGSCAAGTAACTVDTDCTAPQVCDPTTGQCGTAQSTSCTNTSDCPDTQFCNTTTGACAQLADGFCRKPEQCPTTTPICSAQSPNVPGRCAQCLQSSDCTTPGATCDQAGVCTGGNNNVCPPNATPNGSGGCICNPGFHQQIGSPGCIANSTGEGEGEGAAGGEGEGAAGEGEGEGASACSGSSGDAQCASSGGPVNKCTNGSCVCDASTLTAFCLANDPNAIDINTDTCKCIDSAAGEGEGEGEGEGAAAACGSCEDPIFNGTSADCQTEFNTCNSSNACAGLWNCAQAGDLLCNAGDVACCKSERSTTTVNKYNAFATCLCSASVCGNQCGGGVLPQCG